MELQNLLTDIDSLTRQDLSILNIHAEAGNCTAQSILKSWMVSRPFEDATFGGIEDATVLVHFNEPSIQSSRLATWKEGVWLDSEGLQLSGVTHFSELETEFFEDTVHFTMVESTTSISGISLKKFAQKLLPKKALTLLKS